MSNPSIFSPSKNCKLLHNIMFFQSLGQLGKVTKVFGSGDLRVNVNGAQWTFNPLCLMPAPGETPPDVPGILSFVPNFVSM